MQIGDKVSFSFAKGQKEGKIEKLFEKTVYIRVDFPNHKNKLVKRKIHEIKQA